MNDAELVGLSDGFAGLEYPIDRLSDLEPTARGNDRREVVSVESLHHHERDAVGSGLDVVHTRDVLIVDAGGGAPFALEAGDDMRLLAEGG